MKGNAIIQKILYSFGSIRHLRFKFTRHVQDTLPTLLLLAVAAFLLSFTLYNYTHETATCTGAKNCRACKNCKYCKHCAKDGGANSFCPFLSNRGPSLPTLRLKLPTRHNFLHLHGIIPLRQPAIQIILMQPRQCPPVQLHAQSRFPRHHDRPFLKPKPPL